MATKMLSEKLGEVEYDNLIVGLTPPKRVGAGKIASVGSKEATYTRGTVVGRQAVHSGQHRRFRRHADRRLHPDRRSDRTGHRRCNHHRLSGRLFQPRQTGGQRRVHHDRSGQERTAHERHCSPARD